MKGIILDRDLKFVRDINGTYKNGLFKWNDGNFINKIEKTASADFSERLVFADKKAIILVFDGKDYHQLKIEQAKQKYGEFTSMKYKEFIVYLKLGKLTLSSDINTDKSFSDLNRDYKIANLTKKLMLTQPKDFVKTFVEFMFFATAIASVLANWYLVNQSASINKPILTTLNATQNAYLVNQKIQLNQTQTLINLVKNLQHSVATSSYNTSLPTAP
jgi:hypothetical protein